VGTSSSSRTPSAERSPAPTASVTGTFPGASGRPATRTSECVPEALNVRVPPTVRLGAFLHLYSFCERKCLSVYLRRREVRSLGVSVDRRRPLRSFQRTVPTICVRRRDR